VTLLETFYEPALDMQAWARAVVDATRSVLGEGDCRLALFEQDALPLAVGVGQLSQVSLATEGDEQGRELFDALFSSPLLAMTCSVATRSVSRRTAAVIERMHSRLGAGDAMCMLARPKPGAIAFLVRLLRVPTVLTTHERKVMSQVALHFESAYRLRTRPEIVRAVLSTDGKLLHLEELSEQDARSLTERVKHVEQSRARANRRDPLAIDLWKALVGGEMSIVERVDGAKRYYLVLENAPSQRQHRALTRREVEVVRMAARGLSSKLIGYGLGVSTAAISSDLSRAAAKLGLTSRTHLVRAAALLLDVPQAPVAEGTLSAAEREIFELVRLGLSNADIAEQRSRSIRTVANQVASILRKTGAATRRDVVATPPRPATSVPPPRA
jgi:DNA-binding CsgD family transcriptional regulator